MKKTEQDIIKYFKNKLGDNLVSIYIAGSYGTKDFLKNYSDIDLMVLVKNKNKLPKTQNLKKLSDENNVRIGASYVNSEDVFNRIEENKKATRFVSNISLIGIKKGLCRLLYGKDFKAFVPSVKTLLARNIKSELKGSYLNAISKDSQKNIFIRPPIKWIGYIINMSNDLLIAKGIFSDKKNIGKKIKKYYPKFGSVDIIEKAILIRSKKTVKFNKKETEELRVDLENFLSDYKKEVFR